MEMEVVGRARRDSVGSSGGSGSGSGSAEEDDGAGSQESDVPDRQDLFDRIMLECRHNSPGQCFSAEVQEEIERLPAAERRSLVSRTRRGSAPLFVASARGNAALAQYLVRMCGASLEQRGAFRAAGSRHRVTPLWAAAVAGRLDVLRLLVAAGAALDAASDSGSSPLRSACFMSHVEVVRFLLAQGADVHRTNHNGGTCLVNAVQSVELCRMLLDAGADVNAQDCQLKTALHYAVQEYRAEAAQLLLAAGADPLLRTRDGDDALQIACIKGAASLVPVLVVAGGCGPAREADAYELLGATLQDENNDGRGAVRWWRAACAVRAHSVPKRPVRPPAPALRHTREWSAREELDRRAHDVDWVRAQALLVAERVLGPHHKDTLFRLMNRGAAYADARRYERCVALWTWVLELRIRKDTLLHRETCQTLLALTRLLLDVRARRSEGERERGEGEGERMEVEGEGEGEGEEGALDLGAAALHVLRLLVAPSGLPESQRLVRVQPACRVQGSMWDRALRCAAHLLHVLLQPASPARLHPDELRQIRALVRLEACTGGGDSLLHLACSRLNVVRSTYFADEVPQSEGVFPSAPVVRLLLQCGARVTARNHAHCTPLHVAAIPYNCSTELVESLLAGGAHLDQPNRFGESPAELVQLSPRSRVRPLQHVTLACRAARVLMRTAPHAAPLLAARLPTTLRAFLLLHL